MRVFSGAPPKLPTITPLPQAYETNHITQGMKALPFPSCMDAARQRICHVARLSRSLVRIGWRDLRTRRALCFTTRRHEMSRSQHSHANPGLARGGSPFGRARDTVGPSAGHTKFSASWSATLTREGQIQSWCPQSPMLSRKTLPTHSRPAWNERIPVWEQRIPHWQVGIPLNRMVESRERAFSPHASSAARSQITTRDWSLLFSPGRVDTLIRRPWPEYEPESSAPVGRRWCGTNLGRLYEHVLPTNDSMLDRPPSSALNGR